MTLLTASIFDVSLLCGCQKLRTGGLLSCSALYVADEGQYKQIILLPVHIVQYPNHHQDMGFCRF